MKKCGLPTCDESANVLVIVPICSKEAHVPRCLEHLSPNDNYQPIPGRRQPVILSKTQTAERAQQMREAAREAKLAARKKVSR